jgi:hypothetical protein
MLGSHHSRVAEGDGVDKGDVHGEAGGEMEGTVLICL